MNNKAKAFMLDVNENEHVRTVTKHDYKLYESSETNEIIDLIKSEGGENLFIYIDWMGLANSPNLIVLSSHNHYFYSEEELKGISAIVNLKQIDQIKNISVLLQSVSRIMKPQSHFIGFFAEKKRNLKPQVNSPTSKGNSVTSSGTMESKIVLKRPFFNMVYDLILSLIHI